MSGQGVIQAELSIELGKFLAAMNQAGAAIAKFAAAAGGGMAPANQALEKLTASAKPAAAAVDGVADSFQGIKREQVQEGRLVGFYVRELTSFTGASAAAQGAVGNLITGVMDLASRSSPIVAVMGLAALAAGVKELYEAYEDLGTKAQENMKLVAERSLDAAKATDELKRAIQGLPKGSDAKVELSSLRSIQSNRDAYSGIAKAGGDEDVSKRQAEAEATRLDRLFLSLGGYEKLAELEKKINTERARDGWATANKLAEVEGQIAIARAGSNSELVKAQVEFDNTVRQLNRDFEQEKIKSIEEFDALVLAAQLKAQGTQRKAIDDNANWIVERQRKANADLLASLQTIQPVHSEAMKKVIKGEIPETTQLTAAKRLTTPVLDTGKELEAQLKPIREYEERVTKLSDVVMAVGDGIGSVFSSIGSAIGGAAGQFISQLGAMISQTIALVLALTFSDTLMTGPLGVFAAIPMGAAILGSLIGMIASIPSFDVGTLSVPKTGLAMIHAGEAILPAGGPAETYRAGLARMSGGLLAGAGAAGGATTVNVSMNISALDGQSVYRTLTGSRDQLARVVREAVRDGVMR